MSAERGGAKRRMASRIAGQNRRGDARIFLFVQASQDAAGIAYGERSGGKVAGDDAAGSDDRVFTDGDAGADDDAAA
jgi:hypothetical protein